MPLKTVVAVVEMPFHTPLIHDVNEVQAVSAAVEMLDHVLEKNDVTPFHTVLAVVEIPFHTMDDLLNEYLDQHVRVMATDIESQMAGCEPREQDLILHMVQEMLIFFREKG
jgi:hypothetical protein